MPCNVYERKSIQFVSARRKQVDRIIEVPMKDAVLSWVLLHFRSTIDTLTSFTANAYRQKVIEK